VNKKALVLAALASLFLAGCPTSNIYPLYTSRDADLEPAIVGTWVEKGDTPQKGSVRFEKDSGNSYTMIVSDPTAGATDKYDVHLVRLGGNLFADLFFSSRARKDAKDNEDMPIGVVPIHTIVKIQVNGDDLSWSTMEDDPITKNHATGAPPLAYLNENGEGVVVTSGTDALRKYVAAHGKDGFSDGDHLQRSH
jgi:hypothetical protein